MNIDKLSETLIILDHFDSIIRSRTNFCSQFIDFNQFDYVGKRMNDYIKNGFELNEINESEISSIIARESANIRIILHSYTRLNIIDMFSFNEEYNGFFQEDKFNDENIKSRIRSVKMKNKTIRKKLDWDQLKRFRNKIMAHNLRDKNNSNNLSIDVLKEINEILFNQVKAIQYSEIVLEIYDNIKTEFETEIINAKTIFIKQIEKSSIKNSS